MFKGMKLTEKGQELLTSLIAGHNVQFTVIKMGDGNAPSSISGLRDLSCSLNSWFSFISLSIILLSLVSFFLSNIFSPIIRIGERTKHSPINYSTIRFNIYVYSLNFHQ